MTYNFMRTQNRTRAKTLTLVLTCAFLLTSCQQKEESVPLSSVPLNKEQVEQEVRSMLSQYHHDIAEEGLLAEFKYLDSSADFYWVPPGYRSALTYDSVRTILEQNAPGLRSAEFNWETLQVFPLTNEIANYTGIVHSQMTDTPGVDSEVRIIESGTLIKRGKQWMLLSGQSAVLTEPEEDTGSIPEGE